MRTRISGLAMLVVLVSAPAARATCGDDPGDAAAIAAARSEVDATCDCAGTLTHRAYVACARDVVRDRVDHELLSRRCRSTVGRCARRSTCGRPGAVTCCRTTTRGTRCGVRRTAERCTRAGGCVGTFASCCDACGASGCVTTSTTTTTTTTTTLSPTACGPSQYPSCGGDCPAGEHCVSFVISDPPSPPVPTCLCTGVSQACGDYDPNGFFNCGAGPCPPNGVCGFDFFADLCGCVYP